MASEGVSRHCSAQLARLARWNPMEAPEPSLRLLEARLHTYHRWAGAEADALGQVYKARLWDLAPGLSASPPRGRASCLPFIRRLVPPDNIDLPRCYSEASWIPDCLLRAHLHVASPGRTDIARIFATQLCP